MTKTKLIKTASGMEVEHEGMKKIYNRVVVPSSHEKIGYTLKESILKAMREYASQFKPTLLTEDKEGEGQGDLWDELFDHIENTPVDVPWADCIKELKQKFKITKK